MICMARHCFILHFCWGVYQADLPLIQGNKFGTSGIFSGAHPSCFFFWLHNQLATNLKGLSLNIFEIFPRVTFKWHIYSSGIKVALNRSKSRANTHSTLMTVSKTQSDKLSYPHLVIIHTVESSRAWRAENEHRHLIISFSSATLIGYASLVQRTRRGPFWWIFH